MCGRFVAASPRDLLVGWFGVEEVGELDELPPSYNVAPTDDVYAVTAEDGRRSLHVMSWGLGKRINARAETLTDGRRCLLPANGFYEWETLHDGAKQPWFFGSLDGHPLGLAGIWARPGACAIVTTAAAPPVARLHDRMPVILARHDWDEWLDTGAEMDGMRNLLVAPAEAPLSLKRVSTRVNDVRNNDLALLDPAPPPPEPLRLL